MTARLMGRAKLVALLASVAMAAIACASGATGSDLASNGDATSTPAVTSTAGWQDNSNEQSSSPPAAEHDITGSLFLQLDSPASTDTFVTTDSIEVSGHTTVDALLSINDAVVEVNEEGRFVSTVELVEGPNLVEVVASNAAGEERDEVLLVIYEPA